MIAPPLHSGKSLYKFRLVLNNSFGNLEMFKILAENVTDKNPAQNNGMTPLDMAVQMGLLEFVKYILPHESDVKVS